MFVKFNLIAIFLLFFTCLLAQDDAKVSKVTFEGNKAFGKGDLSDLIRLKPSGFFTRLILKKKVSYFSHERYASDQLNIQSFYMNEGFPDATLGELKYTLSHNGKRIKIIFTIDEKKPYAFGSVTFADEKVNEFDRLMRKRRSMLTDRLTSQTGNRFREEQVRNDRLLLFNTLSDIGFPYANITAEAIPDTVNHSADLVWQIDRGKAAFFGNTTVEGNSGVSHHHIRRQLRYKKGDKWSQKRIDNTQKAIYSLGAFNIATVRAQVGASKPDTIPVVVTIKDAPRISTRFGVGYGKEDRVRAFAELQLLRFPGGISRMMFNVKHSYIEPINLSLKYYQPAFPFRSTHLIVNPYFAMQKEPAYKLHKYGADVGMLGSFSKYWSGNFTLYNENINLTLSNQDSIYDNRVTADAYSKSGLTTGVMYSSLTPALDPETGFLFTSTARWNTSLLDGRYPFLKLMAKIVYYHKFNKTLILATKAQAGAIKSIENGNYIPIEERFFGGGQQSLRGWSRYMLGPLNDENHPVGGRSIIELSVEPRIRINSLITWAIFADGGNAWRNSFEFPFNDFRYSAGTGIRVKTPIGPIGIDVARPIFDSDKGWKLHFNIGNPF